jgi:hypothetical protein
LARSTRAKPVYSRTTFSDDAEAAARRPNEFQLQIGAFQDSRSGALHFVERATDFAWLELDSTATIQHDVRVQSEVACIQHARRVR